MNEKQRQVALCLLIIKMGEKLNNTMCGASDAMAEELELSSEQCYATIMLNLFSFMLLMKRKPDISIEEVRDHALEMLGESMDSMIRFAYLYDTKGEA